MAAHHGCRWLNHWASPRGRRKENSEEARRAAHEDPNSPIYGMPITEVERTRTVIVFKRSLAAGFAGIENLLFYKDNTPCCLATPRRPCSRW